jgi:hypothetical protein
MNFLSRARSSAFFVILLSIWAKAPVEPLQAQMWCPGTHCSVCPNPSGYYYADYPGQCGTDGCQGCGYSGHCNWSGGSAWMCICPSCS